MNTDESPTESLTLSNLRDGQQAGKRAEVEACFARLTPRERQVLRLIATGRTTKQIASQLGRSIRTIDVHRAHIIMKMRTRSLAELVRLAVVYGSDDSSGNAVGAGFSRWRSPEKRASLR